MFREQTALAAACELCRLRLSRRAVCCERRPGDRSNRHRRNRSIACCVLIPGLLSACATGPVPGQLGQEEDEQPLTVEEILASAPQPEDYSDPVTCLRRDTYQEVDVINRELLVFHGRRGKAWLNRLRNTCIGLRPDDTLAFDMRDGRLCDLDSFSSIDSFGGPMERTSARCSLGKFEPISPEQAELLREGLAP